MKTSQKGADISLQNQAWICSEFGDYQNLELKHIAIEEPEAGQLLVENACISLGFPDLLMIKGKYQLKPQLFTFVPGTEFCGKGNSEPVLRIRSSPSGLW